MVQEYLRRHNLARYDVRYVFEAGDAVLLKQRVPGKMKCRALGPYTFIRYTGRLAVTAEILNHKGKEYLVSVANLLPVHPPALRLERYSPPPQVHSGPLSSSTIPYPTTSYSGGPPPGVVVQPPRGEGHSQQGGD